MSEVMTFLGAVLLLIRVLNALASLVKRIKALKKGEAPPVKAPQR